ncbi:glycosyltransferase family 4 protein [Hanstruepera ponticola]|uniref:glycosyltransferase family 4 protein n=1 Tax=Hanstruepera ponticola TaxID=2042995 RepID=UPI00177A9E3F|nr:glycosyltransferase family 4 protein [Hanstruepera ponticola]
MKEVLIITNYFPPETGAASNRIFHLASGLQKSGFNVSVLTPLPNYPTGRVFKEYKGKLRVSCSENNIEIHRLWIFASNSKNKILRLIAMLSYSFSLIWYFLWHKIPNKVIVQSPPLIVAFTCMLFLKSKKRKLILNVSDLWPLAGFELGVFKKNLGYKILEKIEYHNYKKADLVLGQSQEILNHVLKIYPKKAVFLYRNYPDIKIQNLRLNTRSDNKLKMVYAGLLGIAQGVFKLCQELDYKNMEFHIYGAGAEKEKIEAFVSNNNLPIFYHGEVTREQLHVELLKYDLAIIPLLNRIYGSVPSKIFEYAKLGLPMLYFGGGEGEDIVKKYGLGWVAESGDYEELKKVLSIIKTQNIPPPLSNHIKNTALENFNFDIQLKSLKNII